MSVKTVLLAAAAVVTLAAPAAAFAHDYYGYDRGDYGHTDRYGYSYGGRQDDGYGYRRGYERDWRARWDGQVHYRDHDGWRGLGWRYGDHRQYGYRD